MVLVDAAAETEAETEPETEPETMAETEPETVAETEPASEPTVEPAEETVITETTAPQTFERSCSFRRCRCNFRLRLRCNKEEKINSRE